MLVTLYHEWFHIALRPFNFFGVRFSEKCVRSIIKTTGKDPAACPGPGFQVSHHLPTNTLYVRLRLFLRNESFLRTPWVPAIHQKLIRGHDCACVVCSGEFLSADSSKNLDWSPTNATCCVVRTVALCLFMQSRATEPLHGNLYDTQSQLELDVCGQPTSFTVFKSPDLPRRVHEMRWVCWHENDAVDTYAVPYQVGDAIGAVRCPFFSWKCVREMLRPGNKTVLVGHPWGCDLVVMRKYLPVPPLLMPHPISMPHPIFMRCEKSEKHLSSVSDVPQQEIWSWDHGRLIKEPVEYHALDLEIVWSPFSRLKMA